MIPRRKNTLEDRLARLEDLKNLGVKYDESDLSILSEYLWNIKLPTKFCKSSYVNSTNGIAMHRLLLDFPKNKDVDHINHDGLDNRRVNLRAVTRSQNILNSGIVYRNPTGYRGVQPIGKHWSATIRSDNIIYKLGVFTSPIKAAKAYDEAANRLHGAFATLNFKKV